MKKIIFLLLSLVLLGCSSQKEPANRVGDISLIDLGYGICSVNIDQVQSMNNSPSGAHHISSNFYLIEQTNTIPMEMGQRFGVDYLLKSPDFKEVQVEIVWTFPKPITNDKGESFNEVRYVNNKKTNQDYHETYALNSKYLMVPGEWTYEMFIQGQKLYERKFQLQ
ncbi:MAG: DUF3859 domain-containing protein [Christiangramia sp.]|nr:hypothetical protein [Christiangramia sp.]